VSLENPRRRRATLLEVLLAMTLLVAGAFPVLDALHGSRQRVGLSRATLELQSQALQFLRDGQALIRSGRLEPRAEDAPRVLEERRGGFELRLEVRRLGAGGLLLLRSRARTPERSFEAEAVTADPYASFSPEVGP